MVVKRNIAGICFILERFKGTYEITKFYVLPDYRKDDNSLFFANGVIDLFDGNIDISTKKENITAIKFWCKVAKKYPDCIDKSDDTWARWLIKSNL